MIASTHINKIKSLEITDNETFAFRGVLFF